MFSWGVNTATVVANQTFIIVKFDYLKYNKNRNSYKIKQKLQNSAKVMFYNVICDCPLVLFHKKLVFRIVTPLDVAS